MVVLVEISPLDVDGSVVVTVGGEVDVEAASGLREALLSQVEAGPKRLIVDVTNVTFIDSAGISALVAGWRKLRELGGSLTIRNPSDQVRLVLAITGVDQLFDVE